MSLEKPSCQEEEDYIRDYYTGSSYDNYDYDDEFEGCESDGCDLH